MSCSFIYVFSTCFWRPYTLLQNACTFYSFFKNKDSAFYPQHFPENLAHRTFLVNVCWNNWFFDHDHTNFSDCYVFACLPVLFFLELHGSLASYSKVQIFPFCLKATFLDCMESFHHVISCSSYFIASSVLYASCHSSI